MVLRGAQIQRCGPAGCDSLTRWAKFDSTAVRSYNCLRVSRGAEFATRLPIPLTCVQEV